MFFRLKNISTYHSSFDFLSFLWGRQGRWYDPILQMRKLKLMALKKMCPVKWLRWVEPGLWSLHLELSPSQPTSYLYCCPQGPKDTQNSTSCHLWVSSTLISVISLLPSFLSSGERKKLIAPQVVPTHLFCGLWKAETSLDLLNHVTWTMGSGKRGAVGGGHRLLDWVEIIKH